MNDMASDAKSPSSTRNRKSFMEPIRMSFTKKNDQSGINMVDLMMWLVIAALLLAAALQAIGYYQKAAALYTLESDLTGAASQITAAAAQEQGSFTPSVLNAGVKNTSWSKDVQSYVEYSDDGKVAYLRASHPRVTGSDVIYLFEACANLKAGVNVIPKAGSVDLSACGIAPSPGTGITTGGMTWRAQRDTPSQQWYGVDSSADGSVIIAGSEYGYLYTSSDSGATFTQHVVPGSGRWRGVVVSDDGTRMAAARIGSYVYTSSDSGKTWTQTTALGNWYDLTGSADLKHLYAAHNSGSIWASHDYGVTWAAAPNTAITQWYSIATSADGDRIVAGRGNGTIYTSSDSGATWTLRHTDTAPGAMYNAVTSSADGKNLAASSSGAIYTSKNYGETWTKKTDSSVTGISWYGLDSSSDGSKLIGGQLNGFIHVSIDGGETWVKQVINGPSNSQWRGVAMSSDGSKMFAAQYSVGNFYRGW